MGVASVYVAGGTEQPAAAAQSIIASLGCLTLVAEVLWAPLVLGEVLGCLHYIGCMLIVTGEALALSFGPHSPPRASIDAVSATIASTQCLVFLLGVGALAGCAYAAATAIEARHPRLPPQPALADYERARREESAALPSAGGGGGSGVQAAWVDAALARLHRPLYGLIAGLLGAATLTLSKGLAELLGTGLQQHSSWGGGGGASSLLASPAFWLLAPAALAGVLLQARVLHAGVSHFGGRAVLPAHQTAWTLGAAAGGLIVWGEGDVLTAQAAAPQGAPPVIPALGVALVLAGVWVVCEAVAAAEAAVAVDAAGAWRTSAAAPAAAAAGQERAGAGSRGARGGFGSDTADVATPAATSATAGGRRAGAAAPQAATDEEDADASSAIVSALALVADDEEGGGGGSSGGGGIGDAYGALARGDAEWPWVGSAGADSDGAMRGGLLPRLP